jgi:hypothetical protein
MGRDSRTSWTVKDGVVSTGYNRTISLDMAGVISHVTIHSKRKRLTSFGSHQESERPNLSQRELAFYREAVQGDHSGGDGLSEGGREAVYY